MTTRDQDCWGCVTVGRLHGAAYVERAPPRLAGTAHGVGFPQREPCPDATAAWHAFCSSLGLSSAQDTAHATLRLGGRLPMHRSERDSTPAISTDEAPTRVTTTLYDVMAALQ